MASIVEVVLKATDQTTGVVRGVSQSLQRHAQQWRDFSRSLAIGGTAVTTALLAAVRTTQRYGEELDKASKITGVAASQLSRLRFAAEQEHATFEGLTTSLRFLSRAMVEAGNRSSESGRVFAALGISVTDAEGRMRNATEVLLELSDAFAGMQDDTTRTALAVKLLGRSGTELIPFLRQGRGEIEAMMREADRLGVTMSDDAARAAKAFGDQLTSLQRSLRGTGVQIGLAAIPAIQDLARRATEAAARFNMWAREHPELVRQLVLVTAAGAGLAVVLGAVGLALPKVAAGFAILRAAAAAATGPLGLAAIAVGTLIAGISREAAERDRLLRAEREGLITRELALRALRGEEAARKVAVAIIKDHEQALRTKREADDAERQAAELAARATALSEEMQKRLAAALAGAERGKQAGVSLAQQMARATDRWREREEALIGTIDDVEPRLQAEIRLVQEAITRFELIRDRVARTRQEKDALTDTIESLRNRLIGLNAELDRTRREFQRELLTGVFTDMTRALEQLQEAAQAGDLERFERLAETFRTLLEPGVIERFRAFAQQQADAAGRMHQARIATELYQQALRELAEDEDNRRRMHEFDRRQQADVEEGIERQIMAHRRRLELMEEGIEKRRAEQAGLQALIAAIEAEIAAIEREIQAKIAAGLPTEELIKSNQRLQLTLEGLRHQSALVGKAIRDELGRALVQLGEDFKRSFETFFTDVLQGAKTFGEALLGFFRSLVNAIISLIAQRLAAMIVTQWIRPFLALLFPFLGFAKGGISPGPLIPIAAAQHGLFAQRPTLAMVAEAGQPEIVSPEPQLRRIFREEAGGRDDRPINLRLKVVQVFDPTQIPRPDPDETVAIVAGNIRDGGIIEQLIRRRMRG